MAKPKKDVPSVQFTKHTLWTAQFSSARVEKYEITKEVQERFRKTLAASENALKKKLETFEPAEVSDTATRALVR